MFIIKINVFLPTTSMFDALSVTEWSNLTPLAYNTLPCMYISIILLCSYTIVKKVKNLEKKNNSFLKHYIKK